MKIVDLKKFIKMVVTIIFIIVIIILICSNAYSKVDIKYKEEIITAGDTLWQISEKEQKNNKYFEGKDIRDIVYEIKHINNLENTNLYNGQKVIVPIY